MKALFWGFGLHPYTLKKITETQSTIDYSWHVALPTARHYEFVTSFLDEASVLVLDPEFPDIDKKSTHDNSLHSLNIPLCTDVDKYGLKQVASRKQEKYCEIVYAKIISFLKDKDIELLLLAQPVESVDGMLLCEASKFCNVLVANPIHLRYFARTVFQDHYSEKRISPITSGLNSSRSSSRIDDFLRSFHGGLLNASQFCRFEQESLSPPEILIRREKFTTYIMRIILHPRYKFHALRILLFNKLSFLSKMYWQFKKSYNSRIFNVTEKSIDSLKYIYYPLQYSPESSINVPNSYFIDQMRVIDLLRLSLPPGFLLLIKEHPSCLQVRPSSFLKFLLNKSNVRLIQPNVPSDKLIKSAQLVISVSGTSALEALFYGVPSATFAETFFSSFVPVLKSLDTQVLRHDLSRLVSKRLDSQLIRCAIHTFANSGGEFNAVTPGLPNVQMLHAKNISTFMNELSIYCRSNQQIISGQA